MSTVATQTYVPPIMPFTQHTGVNGAKYHTTAVVDEEISAKTDNENADCHYNPEFVAKILRGEQSEGVKIKIEDLWK